MSNIVWAATGNMEWLREYFWSCFSHVIRDFFGCLINADLTSFIMVYCNEDSAWHQVFYSTREPNKQEALQCNT